DSGSGVATAVFCESSYRPTAPGCPPNHKTTILAVVGSISHLALPWRTHRPRAAVKNHKFHFYFSVSARPWGRCACAAPVASRPLVALITWRDLLLCAKHLLDSANVGQAAQGCAACVSR